VDLEFSRPSIVAAPHGCQFGYTAGKNWKPSFPISIRLFANEECVCYA
jgi:hypothetical protein